MLKRFNLCLSLVVMTSISLFAAQDLQARVLALKALPDYGNAQVILAPLDESKQLHLIKVIGVSGIKERILVVKENPGSYKSKDYSPLGFKGFRLYDRKNQKTLIKGTVVQTYKLYVVGKRDPLVFVADPELLKGMQSNPLKSEFLAHEFLSKDRIAKPMIAELEKKLTKSFKSECGNKVSFKYATKNTQAMLRGLRAAESLVELCKEDEDYKASIAGIKSLKFADAKSGIGIAKMSGGFTISSSSEQYNSIDRAKEWFLNNLE